MVYMVPLQLKASTIIDVLVRAINTHGKTLATL
jgi:hypothetical protein